MTQEGLCAIKQRNQNQTKPNQVDFKYGAR